MSWGLFTPYLTAMAAANDTTALAEEAVTVCRAVRREGRRFRALNPFEEAEAQLLGVVNRGEWALKSFRNRDLPQIPRHEPRPGAEKSNQNDAMKTPIRMPFGNSQMQTDVP